MITHVKVTTFWSHILPNDNSHSSRYLDHTVNSLHIDDKCKVVTFRSRTFNSLYLCPGVGNYLVITYAHLRVISIQKGVNNKSAEKRLVKNDVFRFIYPFAGVWKYLISLTLTTRPCLCHNTIGSWATLIWIICIQARM